MSNSDDSSTSHPLPSESDPVRAHYERWVYPAPIDDLRRVDFSASDSHFRDLRELYWAYWPTADYREDLDILVAGCGTSAAACYAMLYPRARVVGIDISTASLAHEDRLKQKHGLANLTLHACPIEEIAAVGQSFDFIVSQGVLHHMIDPAAGLRALASVMRPEAVIAIMVYAYYSKVGVYMLRDLFKLLNLQQDEAGLAVVKDTLQSLDPGHRSYRNIKLSGDTDSDNHLVDTFLHRREKAYTVGDCLDLVRDGGLAFQGWDENGFYYPEGQTRAGLPFRRAVDQLKPPELWKAMELFGGNMPGHWFYACRADRSPRTYQIDFESPALMDYIPVARCRISKVPDATGNFGAIARNPFPQVSLSAVQMRVFKQVDARRSIQQCLLAAGAESSDNARQFALNFFQTLWRLGYMHLRLPK